VAFLANFGKLKLAQFPPNMLNLVSLAILNGYVKTSDRYKNGERFSILYYGPLIEFNNLYATRPSENVKNVLLTVKHLLIYLSL